MNKTDMKRIEAIKDYLRQMGASSKGKTAEQVRSELEEAAVRLPLVQGIIVEQVSIGGLRGEWVRGENWSGRGSKAVLYFHGGGFTAGSCMTHRDLAGRIALSSGNPVLTVEYRLAPEHHYPAANEDCLFAYAWLLKQRYLAKDIVIGGDSVGAALALMTLIALKDVGEGLPAGAFLLSPHTDLVNLDGESYQSRAELDPTSSLEANRALLDVYLGDWEGEIPAILSPMRMDLRGLPPLLIHVGDHEVLLSDSVLLAERAREAGVFVQLEVWDNMWCVFQSMASIVVEAQQAIAHIGEFIRSRLNDAGVEVVRDL